MGLISGLFVHGRLQNIETSEDTLGHDITSLPNEQPVKIQVINNAREMPYTFIHDQQMRGEL